MRKHYFRDRDWSDPKWQERMKEYQQSRQRGRIFFGIAIAIAGALWILGNIFNYNFEWDLHWPFVLMGIGLLVGIKSNFQNPTWWILILVSGANLVHMHYEKYNAYIFPGVMIIAGIAIALRPKNKNCAPKYKMNKSITEESSLNIDITFGGRKEMVTSKDFKSGNISVNFGGCELNFMQADITETAILDLKVSFGGIEIIVPSHWHIQNEINPSFGNVEDERSIQTSAGLDNRKVLILRGNCSFGNVEIKSY